MKVTRIRRWVVPGAALSLAAVATLSVVAWELAESAPPPRLQRGPTVVASSAAPPAARPRSPSVFTPVAPPTAPTRPAPDRAPAPVTRSPVPLTSAGPIEPRTTPTRETPALRRALPHLARLVQASTIRDRLEIVDGLARDLDPVQAADVLTGLLDGELPGEFYEAQTLRLGIMAALGRLPTAQANEALVERLAPAWPRQERIMAIEMLAMRTELPRDDLLAMANDDPDAHVRDKARWALQRTR